MKVLITFLSWVILTSSLGAHAVEVIFEEDRDVPIIYVDVVFKGGSYLDPLDRQGLQAFMSRMLLRGTQFKTKDQIDELLDQWGAKLSADTSSEFISLSGAVLSKNLKPFLDLIKEIVGSASFPANEIEKLRSETTSELLEALSSDQAIARVKHAQFLFGSHPYSKPIKGFPSTVAKIQRQDILSAYNNVIRDQQMIIVGNGDASIDEITSWAKELAQKRPGGVALEELKAPQPAKERRLLIVDKPDRTQTQIFIGQIGVRLTDPDFFSLYVGNNAFGGGGFQTRMMQEIRVKRGWSYGAWSGYSNGAQPKSWNSYLFPAAKDTVQALSYTINMLTDLQQNGISPAEFEFSKNSLINNSGFMFNTPEKRVENAKLERIYNLPHGFFSHYADEIKKITLEDVNSAVKKYVSPSKLTITVLATASQLKEKLAEAAHIAPANVKVVPYTADQISN